MPWVVPAIAAGSSIVSGIGSLIAGNEASGAAKEQQMQALQQFLSITVPDPAQQKVILDRYVNQGVIDPVLQHAISQNPTEFNKIVSNPTNKAAQLTALQQLQNEGSSGGLSIQDKAKLQEAQQESIAHGRGAREAIIANQEARGLGGSGFGVAAQLGAQDTQANQDANNSLKAAADASDRALQAVESSGNLATQYDNQDFQQQAQKASAADAINQFNTRNAQDVNAANTGILNYTNEQNLANKQRISDANTDISNKEQMYNSGLSEQNFDNQLRRAAGASGQYNNIAGNSINQGQQTSNTISNVGSGISNAATAYGNNDFWAKYFASQNKNKTNQSVEV